MGGGVQLLTFATCIRWRLRCKSFVHRIPKDKGFPVLTVVVGAMTPISFSTPFTSTMIHHVGGSGGGGSGGGCGGGSGGSGWRWWSDSVVKITKEWVVVGASPIVIAPVVAIGATD